MTAEELCDKLVQIADGCRFDNGKGRIDLLAFRRVAVPLIRGFGEVKTSRAKGVCAVKAVPPISQVVVDATCAEFGLTRAELVSSRGKQDVAGMARRALYLVLEQLGFTQPQILLVIGLANLGAVGNALARAHHDLRKGGVFAAHVARIRDACGDPKTIAAE